MSCLLDYYHVDNFPTARVPAITRPLPALDIDEQPTQKPRIVIVPEPDPLVTFARRDSFAARVFLARLHDHQRRARLFSDVAAMEAVR